jgi:3-oxoacyl-[acyl-carrier protein] reductase
MGSLHNAREETLSMSTKLLEGERALVAQIPIGRPGTPDDIAQVAVAVLSERFGHYVVGTTVEVDGGIGLTSWIPAKA